MKKNIGMWDLGANKFKIFFVAVLQFTKPLKLEEGKKLRIETAEVSVSLLYVTIAVITTAFFIILLLYIREKCKKSSKEGEVENLDNAGNQSNFVRRRKNRITSLAKPITSRRNFSSRLGRGENSERRKFRTENLGRQQNVIKEESSDSDEEDKKGKFTRRKKRWGSKVKEKRGRTEGKGRKKGRIKGRR